MLSHRATGSAPVARIRLTMAIVLGIVVLLAVGFVALSVTPSYGAYDRTTVTVEEDTSVEVLVADTAYKRYVGLSRMEDLGEGEGMLFVHRREGEHAYVMRDMAFPLDLIFIDADGRITEIHHAPVPAEGEASPRYTGVGKYVLEVDLGFADEHGLRPGDHVRIDGY